LKETIKLFIPPILPYLKNKYFNKGEKSSITWNCNYTSWQDALQECKGYNDALIFEKVKTSALKVKNGEAVYERDSVIFNEVQYSWPLLAVLLKIAIENNNKLNIIDFGGSLGSTYFQNRNFLNGLISINWNIVEQKHFVEYGNQFISNSELKFYNNISDCEKRTQAKVILASSVLPYLEKPAEVIKEIINYDFEYILFDRTAFINSSEDIISVQRVPAEIYEASYPAWLFNYEKFILLLEERYELIINFDSAIDPPQKSGKFYIQWKGLFFKKKSLLL